MKVWTCEVCRLAHGAEYALPGDVRATLCPTCYHGFLRIFARAARRQYDSLVSDVEDNRDGIATRLMRAVRL